MTLQWIKAVVEQKKTTIARLCRLIFGEKTEKTRSIFPDGSSGASSSEGSKPKRKGHGRRGANGYPAAKIVKVPHPKFRFGDLCPKCLKGKLYLLKIPAQIVRLVAQPMYRTDQWQNHFGVPLPASTQWELIEAASKTTEPVYEGLIGAAAQGELVHTDDTPMRVQSLRQEISQAQSGDKRTGIFTTSIISKVGELRIAWFFTGQKHAGENLDQLLKLRAADLDKPLQMCDALSRNEPKAFQTILCHCLLPGRRGFVDVAESFPEECRKVIESLREIYRFDALAKEQNLSDAHRLAFHQEHSKPVMDDLHHWMKEQLEQKNTNPSL